MLSAIERVSSHALDAITQLLLGQDVIRLYLCGSSALNAKLENGGVTIIDNASTAPCGYFKLGRTPKYPNLSWRRPQTVSFSFVRFHALRQLVVSLPEMKKVGSMTYLTSLVQLKVLEVQIASSNIDSNLFWLILPPNLTELNISLSPGYTSVRDTQITPINTLSFMPSLTSLKFPSDLSILVDERHKLSPTLIALYNITLPTTWNKSVSGTDLLPPQLQILKAAQGSPHQLPDFMLAPNYYPQTLVDLDLECLAAIDFANFPRTITSLKLRTMKVTHSPIHWDPICLHTFHYRAPRFWNTDPVEGVVAPLFEWIYTQQMICDLKLHSTRRKHDSPASRFRLSRLPPSVNKLSLQGAATEPKPSELPPNLPKHLTSLTLKVAIDSLVEYDTSAQFMSDREAFAYLQNLEELTIQYPFWKLPHSALFASNKLKRLYIGIEAHKDTLLECLRHIPSTLEKLVFEECRQYSQECDIALSIETLPSSLKVFSMNHHNLTLKTTPISWPQNLHTLDIPHCRCTFPALANMPVSVTQVTVERILFHQGSEEELKSLTDWLHQRPATVFSVESWMLNSNIFPADTPLNNPLRVHEALNKLEAFHKSNWLTFMPWNLFKSVGDVQFEL